jgi:hypothetical protein
MNPAIKKYFYSLHIWGTIIKLTVVLGLVYIVFMRTDQPKTSLKEDNTSHRPAQALTLPWTKEKISDEHRIAQQFEIDTLPGLMRRGLIKKYERHQTGTIVFVTGKVWQGRSRFFKKSLLSAVLVYNKVHGYALDTRIIDHRSQQLYAHAVSEDRIEFFD